MGVEIERKFLVTSDAWRTLGSAVRIRQGYLCIDADRTVRVRTLGERARLTVKGRPAAGQLARSEYEYDVPVADANEMLDSLCLRPLLEKTRTTITAGILHWEVDEFSGDNAGLVVAEVELADAHQTIVLPDWIGEEVTHDARYLNANLITHPYARW